MGHYSLTNPRLHSKPIILTVESMREAGHTEKDSVELFNAIDRAYDFEKMEDPFIAVTGFYQNNSYKTMCRDLAGRDSSITAYRIGLIKVDCMKGDFAELGLPNKDCPACRGLWIKVTDSDIFGVSLELNFSASVEWNQPNKSTIVFKDEFNLSNRTKMIIDHVPPGSKFLVSLFPEMVTSLPKIHNLRPKQREKPKVLAEEFELPKFYGPYDCED